MIYERLLRPLLFLQDAERAHDRALRFLGHGYRALRLLQPWLAVRDPVLECDLFGLHFSNPLGLAAGFDKDGVALPAWQYLGFGFVEVGTVTAWQQPGNPRPRLFRFTAERALINRMGFNNRGVAALRDRLMTYQRRGQWPATPVGINIGKSFQAPVEAAAENYRQSLIQARELADFIVLNVSSPNTPNLRQLQEIDRLQELLHALRDQLEAVPGKKPPLLLKVAPDLDDATIDGIVKVACDEGIAAIIAVNTTTGRRGMQLDHPLEGGLSGEPLNKLAMEILRKFYARLRGAIPLIAVGGIANAGQAYERILAGASLVQIYTAFVYQGPLLPRRLLRGLAELLHRDGFSTIAAAVGRGIS